MQTRCARRRRSSTVPGSPGLPGPPAPLDLPDPMAGLPQEASALIAGQPNAAALGTVLMATVLRNPSAGVFLLFEVLRQLTGTVPPADVALAMLDGMVTHQAALLASTSAGQGVLRRLDAVLASAPPSTDAARLNRDRALLAAALFVTPGGPRVPFLELPETPGQLNDRGPVPNAPGPRRTGRRTASRRARVRRLRRTRQG